MGKEELVQELTINSSFVNNINAKWSDLPDRFNKIMSKYDKAYSKSNVKATLQLSSTYHLLIIQLERNGVTNSQYSRQETTELNPVPAEIHDDVLEESICKTLTKRAGVNIVSDANLNVVTSKNSH